MTGSRIAVVGGGIAGLAAAHQLVTAGRPDRAGADGDGDDRPEVLLFERDARVGGRLRASAFAGVEHVDEGADSVLARVPDAVDLARAVGLGDDLVHPEPVGAAVWLDGLHRIPDGLLMGVPRRLGPLARSDLLSWRGKARAAVEPLLPRSDPDDSIGTLIRSRFGDEVHDRIVDALVGSIYATDTDRASVAEVPQLAALAESRSLLLAARRAAAAAGTATAASAPVFAAPRTGIAGLAAATRADVERRGVVVRTATGVGPLQAAGSRWRVGDELVDAVILAVPAAEAAALLADELPAAAARLRGAETADVAMVTLHVDAAQWPERLHGLSGYLVPKSVQRAVTAASFGSQKWAHWSPEGGGQILRVSLGRDGLPVLQHSDSELLDMTRRDLAAHLGVRFEPLATRLTRWEGAFAQYRPHHARWVAETERLLPPTLQLAGSAYRGIGVPACVRDGRRAAAALLARPDRLTA